MSQSSIESALRKAWRDGGFFTDANTAYDNVAFEPVAGTPWSRVAVIPSQPEVTSLGDSGYDEHNGVLQIDLFYPLNKGTGEINAKADAACALFKAGARFSYGGQTVVIRSSGRNNGRKDGGWFRVTVSVFYLAHIAR